MSDEKNQNSKTTNSFWIIFSTIIKSIIVLFIIGTIMYVMSLWGAEGVYQKNSSNRSYIGGWTYHEDLNPIYGLMGIIIYILINYFGFSLYNFVTSKFKSYKITISRFIFLVHSIIINMIMLIVYWSIFGSYSFNNQILELFNILIIRFGFVSFPILFIIIYSKIKK